MVFCVAQERTVEAEPVTVPENSSFERIQELVAHRYRVSVEAVDVLRSTAQGGTARVRARDKQQVDTGVSSSRGSRCLDGLALLRVQLGLP